MRDPSRKRCSSKKQCKSASQTFILKIAKASTVCKSVSSELNSLDIRTDVPVDIGAVGAQLNAHDKGSEKAARQSADDPNCGEC